jgi:hypothetical protein
MKKIGLKRNKRTTKKKLTKKKPHSFWHCDGLKFSLNHILLVSNFAILEITMPCPSLISNSFTF